MLRQAVILAGGQGTRLGALAQGMPKPMLDLGGQPLLETLLRHLRRNGIERVILAVSYRADRIVAHFDDGGRLGLKITYLHEDTPAGTGGVLALGADHLDEAFLLLNGDTVFDANYHALYRLFRDSGADGALALRSVPDAGRYGAIAMDGRHVARFEEKGCSGPGFVNGGVYVLHKRVGARVSRLPCALEQDILPALAVERRLVGLPSRGFFIDIGIPDSLAEARRSVPQWRRRPVAFLDRDGVINRDQGYVCEPGRFAWMPGAPEAIRLLNESGHQVVVVSNQAGIARGYFSEAELRDFMRWVDERLSEHGAHIDGFYYCPHHPEQGAAPYRAVCDCRKPAPGLLLRALADFDAEPARAFLIGDQDSDLEAARRAGIQAFHFDGRQRLDDFIAAILAAKKAVNA